MCKYNPKVSIIIPAYNASNYIHEAINSALDQTYKNIEIIVVNDGSTDNGETAKVVQEYGNLVRYFEKENGGSSSALNFGIRNMEGEWFSWLSHDDLYYPEKVERQIEFLQSINIETDKREKCVLFAAGDLINENGSLIRKSDDIFNKSISMEISSRMDNRYLIANPRKFSFNGCSCLIHKSVFDEIGYFDENLRLINDLDMWYRIFSNNYNIHYIHQVSVSSRIHGKQVSRSIGYSTQNHEQTFYLERSLDWLNQNCNNDFLAYYSFGKMAYLGLNIIQADKAFQEARRINKSKSLILLLYKWYFISYAKCRRFLKKIYILFIMRR